jgi:hypothetical protein
MRIREGDESLVGGDEVVASSDDVAEFDWLHRRGVQRDRRDVRRWRREALANSSRGAEVISAKRGRQGRAGTR